LALGGVTASSAASPAPNHHSKVLVVREHTTNFIVSKQPPGPGDSLVAQSDLLETSHHRKVGVVDVHCVFGFADHALCDATAVFTGRGQINVSGEITHPFTTKSFDIAITGGTNVFRGVDGQFHSDILSMTDSIDTFRFDEAEDN